VECLKLGQCYQSPVKLISISPMRDPTLVASLFSPVIEGNGDRVEIAIYRLDETDWTSGLSVKQIISRVLFSL
jgi:hypothetical protein